MLTFLNQSAFELHNDTTAVTLTQINADLLLNAVMNYTTQESFRGLLIEFQIVQK